MTILSVPGTIVSWTGKTSRLHVFQSTLLNLVHIELFYPNLFLSLSWSIYSAFCSLLPPTCPLITPWHLHFAQPNHSFSSFSPRVPIWLWMYFTPALTHLESPIFMHVLGGTQFPLSLVHLSTPFVSTVRRKNQFLFQPADRPLHNTHKTPPFFRPNFIVNLLCVVVVISFPTSISHSIASR